MQDLKAFRIYYNDYLHRELIKLEKRRKRLVFGIIFFAMLLVGSAIFIISLNVAAMTFFMLIPLYIYLNIVRARIYDFKHTFKPMVVNAILKFIDPNLNYFNKEFIPKDTFVRSGIFPIDPQIYKGEDYIMGKIGEVAFELCELEIYHPSVLKGKLIDWFKGIFFHANFRNTFLGRIVILPRTEWQTYLNIIKKYTKYGGGEIKGLLNAEFQKEFAVYAQKGVRYQDVLSKTLLQTILDYKVQHNKKIYVAFRDSHFYIAINEPYELLEASIFFPNLDFKLLCMFYEELYLFTRLVEDFDIRKT
jgi:Protein of unknown function (DUF3137)